MNTTQSGIYNAAGEELTKGIRNGKLGRWLTITSFGRVDGLADPVGDHTHLDVVGRGQE